MHAAPRVRTEAAQKWTSGHTRPVGDAMTRIDDEMTRKGRPDTVRNNVKVELPDVVNVAMRMEGQTASSDATAHGDSGRCRDWWTLDLRKRTIVTNNDAAPHHAQRDKAQEKIGEHASGSV